MLEKFKPAGTYLYSDGRPAVLRDTASAVTVGTYSSSEQARPHDQPKHIQVPSTTSTPQ